MKAECRWVESDRQADEEGMDCWVCLGQEAKVKAKAHKALQDILSGFILTHSLTNVNHRVQNYHVDFSLFHACM